jgi:hypothetical protein
VRPDEPGCDERRLLAGTLRTLAVVAVVLASGAALLDGWTTAASMLLGVGLVAVLFGGSAAVLAWAASNARGGAVGLQVGAGLGRLVLYALVLSGLTGVGWVNRPALALGTVLAFAITLGYELRALSRLPRLYWVDATAGRPPATNPTRSR